MDVTKSDLITYPNLCAILFLIALKYRYKSAFTYTKISETNEQENGKM